MTTTVPIPTPSNPLFAAFSAATSSLNITGYALGELALSLAGVASKAEAEASRVREMLATLPVMPDVAADSPFAQSLGLDVAAKELSSARECLGAHVLRLTALETVAAEQASQIGTARQALLSVAMPGVSKPVEQPVTCTCCTAPAVPGNDLCQPCEDALTRLAGPAVKPAVEAETPTIPTPAVEEIAPPATTEMASEQPLTDNETAAYQQFAGWVEGKTEEPTPTAHAEQHVTVAALFSAVVAPPAPLTIEVPTATLVEEPAEQPAQPSEEPADEPTGPTLTPAEERVLTATLTHLAGLPGTWQQDVEVFTARTAQGRADRRTLKKLADKGILAVHGIEVHPDNNTYRLAVN